MVKEIFKMMKAIERGSSYKRFIQERFGEQDKNYFSKLNRNYNSKPLYNPMRRK